MKNSALILWFEGLNPAVFGDIPTLSSLAAGGVDVVLQPAPLVERSTCYYQMMAGIGSGKTGRFDAVYPEQYTAREDPGTPEGAQGRLLKDILVARRLAVTQLEVENLNGLDALAGELFDCAIVRVLGMQRAAPALIDSIVRRGLELAGPSGHLFALTGVWEQSPSGLVNLNDFLADVGLLEVGALRKREGIVWPETLAYALGTGQVWVNLRGREPRGVVSSGAEYQEVCEALMDQLRSNWLDPQTREPVVQHVLKREEAYRGQVSVQSPRPGGRISSGLRSFSKRESAWFRWSGHTRGGGACSAGGALRASRCRRSMFGPRPGGESGSRQPVAEHPVSARTSYPC